MGAKKLVSTYIDEVWNNGDLDALEDLTTTSFTYHLGGQKPRDLMGMKQFLSTIREAFPDWQVEVDDVVVEGVLAAIRWSGKATHLGPFHGVPATGKQISVSGMNFYRLEDGKIAQEWEQMDSLGMLGDMGLLPPT